MGWRGPIRQPAAAAGANKAGPRPERARLRRTEPDGIVRHISQTSSLAARMTGQNGHGPAKGAVIRTASFARTLYTICTHPLLRIDAQ